MEDGNNPEGRRGDGPDEHPGEDEVLRSGQAEDEISPGHSQTSEASAESAAGESRHDGSLEFRTYRYKGWLPSGRFILGKEILGAFIAGAAVYVSLALLFVMAGFFRISLDFLAPLAEYGLLRLDLAALLVGIYVLFRRIRFRLAWRKHLLAGK